MIYRSYIVQVLIQRKSRSNHMRVYGTFVLCAAYICELYNAMMCFGLL